MPDNKKVERIPGYFCAAETLFRIFTIPPAFCVTFSFLFLKLPNNCSKKLVQTVWHLHRTRPSLTLRLTFDLAS